MWIEELNLEFLDVDIDRTGYAKNVDEKHIW
jgi:hypothetical protein